MDTLRVSACDPWINGHFIILSRACYNIAICIRNNPASHAEVWQRQTSNLMTGIKFPELEQLKRIIEQLGDRAQVEVIERIQYQEHEFPIHCITLGSTQPDAPVLAFFGGVHGLEKIGSEVILSYLETISQLLDWDQEFLARLEQSRLVFVPLVNPVGVYLGTRCNGNGVDLMRNSPVEGVGATRIYSGHRITPHLP